MQVLYSQKNLKMCANSKFILVGLCHKNLSFIYFQSKTIFLTLFGRQSFMSSFISPTVTVVPQSFRPILKEKLPPLFTAEQLAPVTVDKCRLLAPALTL